MTCGSCDDTGWVCETCGTRWELRHGGTCCGAGQPCECNPDAEFEFAAIQATTDPDSTATWMQ